MGIFLSNIPEYVQKKLFSRMNTENRNPGIYSKAVWSRAKCWAVKKSTNVEAPVLMGGTLNDNNSLKGGFSEIYQPRSEGGSDGSSLKPMAGITNISVSTFGTLGSTRKAQIQFIVYGMDQLDLFLSTYMSLGSTVSVEYGWSYHQNYGSTYEAISGDIVGSFKAMQERVAQGGGDYDGFVGLVSNYNFKAMPDGGFDCGIDLIGHGQAILASQASDGLPKITIDDPAGDEDVEITMDKIASVNFRNAINNLDKTWNFLKEIIGDQSDGLDQFEQWIEEGGVGEQKTMKYISWGFLEDNFLSKYFGYVSVATDGEKITFDVRSLNKLEDGTFESVKCLNHPELRRFGVDPKVAVLGDDFEVDKKTGNLREIFIGLDTIKDAFGNSETLQAGLDSLFAKVNSNFADIWDFNVVADEDILTRSKVVDTNYTVIPPEEALANEKRSTAENPNGLFYFPAYDKQSIVKNIDLEGKMPTAAAMTVLYGKNKPPADDPDQGKSASGDDKDGIVGQTEGADNEDLVLNKIRSPKSFGNPNGYDANTELREGAIPDSEETIYSSDGEIVDLTEDIITRLIDSDSQNETTDDAEEDDQQETEKTEEELKKEQKKKEFFKTFPDRRVLTKEEERALRINVRKTKDGTENTVPFLIPINLSLTMDGIGGIIWGNAFHCEYLPDLYKRKGIFQVTGVDHQITAGGWETTLKGQMRSVSLTALESIFE
tara:strand:+ start:2229 stop:4373 length:2145 start_codon:yes stop_codon:yes gene_type:complete